jgi:phage-related protein
MWQVGWHKDADLELNKLPAPERVAMIHAADKLKALGPRRPYPHQSSIRGVQGLRELRPRGGRSRWRAFYQRQGDVFVIGAVGPEAEVDPLGFDRAIRDALARLEER